ncbi:Diguanylate cyclase DgcM [Methylophilaceae bacterium]|nr:Diguanylate cyclase DgcM [Methylophilaceae bacterium]
MQLKKEMNNMEHLPFTSLDAIPLPIIIAESVIDTSCAQEPKRLHRFINRAFYEQIGYSMEEIPDTRTWFELAYPDPDYRAKVMHGWNRTVEQSQSQGLCTAEMTTLIHCKNGQKRWFNVVAQIRAAIMQNLHIVTFKDIHDLKCAVEENSRLSRIDPLTNLANRREARHRIELELSRSDRTFQPFSVVLCDIDHFKLINDTYGHACGDFMLCNVADALRRTSREIDCIARWGGEEFLLVLPLTDKSAALKLAERLRKAVESLSCRWETESLSVSISLGCVTSSHENSVESLIDAADKALYRAKNAGRNRVCE